VTVPEDVGRFVLANGRTGAVEIPEPPPQPMVRVRLARANDAGVGVFEVPAHLVPKSTT
jgi:hypothetical protein